MEFRPNSREGFWLCFQLPLAMFLTKSEQNSYNIAKFLAWILSIHCTYFAISTPLPRLKTSQIRNWLLHCSSFRKPEFPFLLLILMKIIIVELGFFRFTLYLVQGCSLFIWILPKLFETFKHSFSFGEGCLVLQSLVIFGIKVEASFIYDEHDSMTDVGKINIIANVGLVSLLILCSISFIPWFNFVNSPKSFFIAGKYIIIRKICTCLFSCHLAAPSVGLICINLHEDYA